MRIYIFDIDNTLSDSYPSLVNKKNFFFLFRFFSESLRVIRLPFFEKMTLIVKNRIKRKNVNIFFLSARHYSLWIPTYLSLIIRLGFFHPKRLILVKETNLKINILKSIISKNEKEKIRLIDDLSYNHENGEVKFYEKVISFCKKNKHIIYFDKEIIDSINLLND